MRNRFRDELLSIKASNEKLKLIVSDIGFGVFEEFADKYPESYFNLGISEANIIGVSSGLASYGFIPIVYTIVPFLLMRPYEQIRIDLALQKRKVILVGVGGGLSYGNLGPTHHSIEDIGLAMGLPNLSIYAPAEPDDIKEILEECISNDGPSYIRLGKNGEKNLSNSIITGINYDLYGNITSKKIILSYGPISFDWHNYANDYLFIKLKKIKPLCMDFFKYLDGCEKLILVEEHTNEIGIGNKICRIILEKGIKIDSFKHIAINDQFIHKVGSREYLLDELNMLPNDRNIK